MSEEEFFGRPLSGSTENIEFDLCEVCQRRSPTWLEINIEDQIPVIRFSCDDCHQNYINRQPVKSEMTRQISDDEEKEDNVRPGWVDDFIKESSATIEAVDAAEKTNSEDEGQVESQMEFSEAPSSFQEPSYQSEVQQPKSRRLANWAPKFIEQALFGSDPEGWLVSEGGYNDENIGLTIETLGSFANHDITSVKLTAIQCLQGAFNRNASRKTEITEQLSNYQHDKDPAVDEFATQTIAQMQ